MKWFRSEITEAKLKSLKLKFDYVEVGLQEINILRSLKNMARIDEPAKIDDAIECYGMAMEQPDASFPSIVLAKIRGELIVVDGNQRINAYEMLSKAHQREPLMVFLLATKDSSEIELVTRSFNRTNGVGQSKESAVSHCIYILNKNPNMLVAEVATAFGLKTTHIKAAAKIRKIISDLESAGVKTAGIPLGVLVALGKLYRNANVQAAVASLAVDYKLTIDQAGDVVKDVSSRKTEASMMAEVGRIDTQLANEFPRRGNRDTHRVKHSFSRYLSQLTSFVSRHPTVEHLQLTAEPDLLGVINDWQVLREMIDEALGCK